MVNFQRAMTFKILCESYLHSDNLKTQFSDRPNDCPKESGLKRLKNTHLIIFV